MDKPIVHVTASKLKEQKVNANSTRSSRNGSWRRPDSNIQMHTSREQQCIQLSCGGTTRKRIYMIQNSVVRVPKMTERVCSNRSTYVCSIRYKYFFREFKRKTPISADRMDRLIHKMTCKTQHPILNNTLIHDARTTGFLYSVIATPFAFISFFISLCSAFIKIASITDLMQYKRFLLLVLLHSHRVPSGSSASYGHYVCVCSVKVPSLYDFIAAGETICLFRGFSSFSLFFSGFVHFIYSPGWDRGSCRCVVRNMFVSKRKRSEKEGSNKYASVCPEYARALARFQLFYKSNDLHTVWKNVCLFHMVLRDYRGDPHCRLLQFSVFISLFLSISFCMLYVCLAHRSQSDKLFFY